MFFKLLFFIQFINSNNIFLSGIKIFFDLYEYNFKNLIQLEYIKTKPSFIIILFESFFIELR